MKKEFFYSKIKWLCYEIEWCKYGLYFYKRICIFETKKYIVRHSFKEDKKNTNQGTKY